VKELICGRPSGACLCTTEGEMASCNMSETISTWQVPVAETVLDEAAQLTNRTRKDVYAHPSVNFDRIARMWSVILGCEVTPEQHALCMIAVKLSRLIETPGHRDSLVDIAGYARTVELLGEGGGE
jgi:hypothetical protein